MFTYTSFLLSIHEPIYSLYLRLKHYGIVPVDANFSVNQMCPSICKWKLVIHRYCFGDNRRTKDIRKIKLCGLKACCVTLISCSISHNFPALKRWNEKSEA